MMHSDFQVVKQEVLSDSAMDISVVEADTYSAGKEHASTSVVVSVAGGGRVSLHVTESSPVSKRKIVHVRGVMIKVKRIDLRTHFKLRLQVSSSMLDVFRLYSLTFYDLDTLRLSLQYCWNIALILDEVQSLGFRVEKYLQYELLIRNIFV